MLNADLWSFVPRNAVRLVSDAKAAEVRQRFKFSAHEIGQHSSCSSSFSFLAFNCITHAELLYCSFTREVPTGFFFLSTREFHENQSSKSRNVREINSIVEYLLLHNFDFCVGS